MASIKSFEKAMLSIATDSAQLTKKVANKMKKNIKARYGKYPIDTVWPRTQRGVSPLLDTGQLKNSTKSKSTQKTAEVSNSNMRNGVNIAAVHEFGSQRLGKEVVPKRPVFKPEAKKVKIYAKEMYEEFIRTKIRKA